MPEPTAIEGVLNALVAAIEARESAEPDLPAWESDARLRHAEAQLLRAYRESAPRRLVALSGSRRAYEEEIVSVEVA